jgi:hypothetical protein
LGFLEESRSHRRELPALILHSSFGLFTSLVEEARVHAGKLLLLGPVLYVVANPCYILLRPQT